MEADLAAALRTVDPAGVGGAARKAARMARLRATTDTIIRQAYTDCERLVRTDAHRIGKASADMAVAAISEELP